MQQALKAVLFDMDGVITDTAKAHAAAWKQVFDDYLASRPDASSEQNRPFDIEFDYRRYVDGKPRNDGVENFLASRGISLPFGKPEDGPDAQTVSGIGTRKNGYFRAWLAANRVQPYAGTLALLGALRSAGVKLGVFSASRNAEAVLDSAQVLDLFDTKVDGGDLARLRLPGKPDPAMLLEAAARLAAKPDQCAIVEDSIAGVEAGTHGGFAQVIGVDRGDYSDALRKAGAHLVVGDLAELVLTKQRHLGVKTLANLPAVHDREDDIRQRLAGRQFVVFLDYDGTLTPIVEDHTKAFLSQNMRGAVSKLAEHRLVAVVSGRDLAMLQSLVQLDSVIYAGSHGFEIAGLAGGAGGLEKGVEFLGEIDQTEKELRAALAGIAGHSVERKRFSIAVHFRQVADGDLAALEAVVDQALASHPRLQRGHGKKVFELQPRIDWNKGEAVRWLLDRVERKQGDIVPIYIGDDITDEHAFRALSGSGICVAVRDNASRQTSADYALAKVDEVQGFLELLVDIASADDQAGSQGKADRG